MEIPRTYEELTARKKAQLDFANFAMVVLAILCLALVADPVLASSAGTPWESTSEKLCRLGTIWAWMIVFMGIVVILFDRMTEGLIYGLTPLWLLRLLLAVWVGALAFCIYCLFV